MSALPNFETEKLANPLDVVENLATAHEWLFDRSTDDELNMTVEGTWSDLHVCLNWREDIEGLHLASTFDLRVPDRRREEVSRLVSLINEQLFLGHFDLWRTDGALLFRNGLLLTGGAEALPEQCEALMALALEACERYYPAFQFVIWAGKSAEEAIEACLMETVGEA
ncbi:MAG: YbjN domain-containing protein [Hyphomicrobiales bacterium]